MSDEKDLEKEIAERRARMRDDSAAASKKQRLIDMSALADAEEEHGFQEVVSIDIKAFREGLPTLVIVKAPAKIHYRKYLSQFRSAKKDTERGDAQELLGKSCMIYPPEGDIRDQLLEARAGLYVVAGIEAAKLAEGAAEEEKKG